MSKLASDKVIGRRLKRLRKDHGLTQTDVAEGIGYQQPTVCGWEAGKFRPGMDALMALSAFFDVPFEDIAFIRPPSKRAA